MRAFKIMLVLALIGAVLGTIVATTIGSSVLAWYPTPGASVIATCPCSELAKQVTSRLVRAQLTGASIGAVTFMIVGAFVRAALKKRKAEKQAARAVPEEKEL